MLKQRVVTSLLAGVTVIAGIYLLPAILLVSAFVVVIALAAWEWAALAGLRGRGECLAYAILVGAGAAIPAGAAFGGWPGPGLVWLGLVVVLWLLAAGWLLTGGQPVTGRAHRRWGWLALGLVLLPAAVLAIGLITLTPDLGRGPLLYAMLVVWVADTAAYFSGRALGRHRLAPRVSAGKTWEGVAGGLTAVAACAVAAAGVLAVPAPQYLPWVALALAAAALSIVGDLMESVLKREAGAKDSGTLLPGHGGMLDRIDGQLAALPVMALGLGWLAGGGT